MANMGQGQEIKAEFRAKEVPDPPGCTTTGQVARPLGNPRERLKSSHFVQILTVSLWIGMKAVRSFIWV
jgi:hypothetical protein